MKRQWIGVAVISAAAMAGCESSSHGPEYGRLPYPGRIYPPAEAPGYQVMPNYPGAAAAPGTPQPVPGVGPEGTWQLPPTTQPPATADVSPQPVVPVYPLYPDYSPDYSASPEPQPVPMPPSLPGPPGYIEPYQNLWDYYGGWVSPVYPFVPYWDERGHGWEGDHDHDHHPEHWEDGHGGGGQVYRVPSWEGRNLPRTTPPLGGHPPQPGAIPTAPQPGAISTPPRPVGVRPMTAPPPASPPPQPRGIARPNAVGARPPAPAPRPPVINEPHSIRSAPPGGAAGSRDGAGAGRDTPGGPDAGGPAGGGAGGGRTHR